LAQDVVDRILAERLGSLDERLSKANLFDLPRADVMLSDVRNPIFWPHQLIDFHVLECTSVEVSRQ
jgi:hypothetical protein